VLSAAQRSERGRRSKQYSGSDMPIEIIDHVADWLITLSWPVAFISFSLIINYLVRKKVTTSAGLHFHPIWPKLVFKYRDHTRKNRGKTGVWYYTFSLSVSVLAIVSVAELLLFVSKGPPAIFLLVCFTVLIIIPLLGYVVLCLARERLF
jgi:hypothetical protein